MVSMFKIFILFKDYASLFTQAHIQCTKFKVYYNFSFCYSPAENEKAATNKISSNTDSELPLLNLDQNDDSYGKSTKIVVCFSITMYNKL